MLRVIVKTADATMSANVGGPVEVRVRTFDIRSADDIQSLESFMSEFDGKGYQYVARMIDGVEVVRETKTGEKHD